MTSRLDVRATLLGELAELAAWYAGVQPSMLDRRQLRNAMELRMKVHRLIEAEDYIALCRADETEQLAIVEATANGETSFFRDRAVFEELTSWCLARVHAIARQGNQASPLRILSAPCSTGEEPYSIAAALLLASVEAERFTIDAVDISDRAIRHAESAVYSGLSLRNLDTARRDAFLHRVPNGWRVNDAVRACVQFRRVNLMQAGALDDVTYDLILSRNLLIYQSPAARTALAATLSAALAPDGRLVVGSADWGRDLEPWFALEQPVRSFAAGHRLASESGTVFVPTEPRAVTSATTSRQRPASSSTKVQVASSARRALSDAAEEELAKTADLYRQALEAQIQKHDRLAEELCRQVLYLDPGHLPSLELLARLHRPHVTGRVRAALAARLLRKRDAVHGKAKGGPAA